MKESIFGIVLALVLAGLSGCTHSHSIQPADSQRLLDGVSLDRLYSEAMRYVKELETRKSCEELPVFPETFRELNATILGVSPGRLVITTQHEGLAGDTSGLVVFVDEADFKGLGDHHPTNHPKIHRWKREGTKGIILAGPLLLRSQDCDSDFIALGSADT